MGQAAVQAVPAGVLVPVTATEATMSDVLPFFRTWLGDPLRVGAVMPSGRALAAAITAEVTPGSVPVIELGAGTGAFTEALLQRGVPEERLLLVEPDPGFARLLEQRFPAAAVLRVDAAALGDLQLFAGEQAGVVISGLPLLSMPARKVIAILEGAFHHLRPGGAFFQFTYGPRCPVSRPLLDRLGLRALRTGGTLANVPPASVYRLTRRRPRAVVGAVSL